MNQTQLAMMWYRRVEWVQHGHYVAALYFDRRHWLLGGVNVVLAAAVGTSLFAALSNETNNKHILAITGGLSVVTTLVAALQTFLSYGGRADRHRVSGARYGIVGRELELMLSQPELEISKLPSIKENLDSLAQECPHIPDVVHKILEKRNKDKQNQSPDPTVTSGRG